MPLLVVLIDNLWRVRNARRLRAADGACRERMRRDAAPQREALPHSALAVAAPLAFIIRQQEVVEIFEAWGFEVCSPDFEKSLDFQGFGLILTRR